MRRLLLGLSLTSAVLVSVTQTRAEDAGTQSAGQSQIQAQIQAMISDAWVDATLTWQELLGPSVYRDNAPQINFVPAVRASHCYGLYISPGPVYCSGNTTVFVSIASMEELRQKVPAVGDAGLAFLVAHEFGHHVQKVTGRFGVFGTLSRLHPGRYRQLALRFELEADCLAGVWASKSPKFAATDGARTAMVASLDAIGDDKMLASSGAAVDPAAFTHGSSAQRVRWFNAGLNGGRVAACHVLEEPDF
jgi:uncharacterized protein